MAAVRSGIFVNYIPLSMSEDDLKDLFSSFGRVLELIVVKRPEFTTHAFGYVMLDTAEDTRRAIKQLNGLQVGERRLKVEPTFGKASHIFSIGNGAGQQDRCADRDQWHRPRTGPRDSFLAEAARRIRSSWEQHLSLAPDPLEWPTLEQLRARLGDLPYEMPLWKCPRERRRVVSPYDVGDQPVYWIISEDGDEVEEEEEEPDGTVSDLLCKRHPEYAAESRDLSSSDSHQEEREGRMEKYAEQLAVFCLTGALEEMHLVTNCSSDEHDCTGAGSVSNRRDSVGNQSLDGSVCGVNQVYAAAAERMCCDDDVSAEAYARQLLNSCVTAALER